MNPIIIIPARLAASRLPNKPLADINGDAMIIHCWQRAMEADIGPVVIAAGDIEIVDIIKSKGGDAILTDPSHPSGSDRIWQALLKYDMEEKYDVIVNLQGDLPTIEPEIIKLSLEPLTNDDVDIATLVVEITDNEERHNPNVVKAFAGFKDDCKIARALTFTRSTAPFGDGPLYHHIGLYSYRRKALEKFIKSSPSILEIREKLEQLRALELGLRIDVRLVKTMPLGVDTKADLEMARKILRTKNNN